MPPPPLVSGRSCVEGSVVSVRSIVCAHFVSENVLQIVADFWQIRESFCSNLIGGWGPCSVQTSVLRAWKNIKNDTKVKPKGPNWNQRVSKGEPNGSSNA